MPWELEIHHLDIASVGDATVFIARLNGVIQRSMLIDGGKANAADIIHPYLTTTLNLARLDVIAVTHYDEDHFDGIVGLLERTDTAIYNHVVCYDQGRPPNNDKYYANAPLKPNGNDADTLGKRGRGNIPGRRRPKSYERYVQAITGVNTRNRITALLNSFSIVVYDNANLATIPRGVVNSWSDNTLMTWNYYVGDQVVYPPNDNIPYADPAWLVGQEVMWGAVGGPPLGAPTITCIAANKYVWQQGGGAGNNRFVSDVDIYDGPNRVNQIGINRLENLNDNAKSLAFSVQFNNFRYYIGGDIETPQEDGWDNINPNPPVFQPGIRAYLNLQSTINQRVLAMKASHHGSLSASSRTFINQLFPSAVFISTGAANHHNHPAQSVVNILDGYPAEPILGDPTQRLRHPPEPPVSPLRPNPYYLTGYQDPANVPPLSYGGTASMTAGVPPGIAGHILLTVNENQSNRAVAGQIYHGIVAAVGQINAATGLVADAASIASNGARGSTTAAVAAALGVAVAATAAINAAAWVGTDNANIGVIAAAVAAANPLIATPVAAAAAAVVAAAGIIDLVRGVNVPRVNNVGAGAAAALGQAVVGATALNITNAATAAGATAAAATAAGNAAALIYQRLTATYTPQWDAAVNAGYAAAAAIGGATAGGATAAQATVIAVALAMTVPVGLDLNNDILYIDPEQIARWTTEAALGAALGNNVAALVGAVASATYYLGDPVCVGQAVEASLLQIGTAAAAATAAGVAANLAATLPNNDLYTVTFTSLNGLENIAGVS